MQKSFGLLAGLLSSIGTVLLAGMLLTEHLPQNVASWGLWFLLDALALGSATYAGSENTRLQWGCTVSGFLVVPALLTTGTWHWGTPEWLATAAVGCCVFAWWHSGARSAVVASAAGVVVAGFPALRDAWLSPYAATAWYWWLMTIASLLSIGATKKRTVEDRLFPITALVLNLALGILSIL